MIADIIADHEISDTDDDQLYYTKIFLDVAKRVRNNVVVSCLVTVLYFTGEVQNETRSSLTYIPKFEWG